MTDALLEAITDRREQLRANGYTPLPLYGKQPPIYGGNNKRKGFTGWEQLRDVTPTQIAMWAKTWPDAINTGVLTHNMPTLDIDILDQDAAVAIEELARERFEERGWFLVRIGLPPKRADSVSYERTVPQDHDQPHAWRPRHRGGKTRTPLRRPATRRRRHPSRHWATLSLVRRRAVADSA